MNIDNNPFLLQGIVEFNKSKFSYKLSLDLNNSGKNNIFFLNSKKEDSFAFRRLLINLCISLEKYLKIKFSSLIIEIINDDNSLKVDDYKNWKHIISCIKQEIIYSNSLNLATKITNLSLAMKGEQNESLNLFFKYDYLIGSIGKERKYDNNNVNSFNDANDTSIIFSLNKESCEENSYKLTDCQTLLKQFKRC